MSQVPELEIRVIRSLSSIAPSDWQRVLPNDAGPFLHYSFLSLLEETGCVCAETGWEPAHLALYAKGGNELLGAMPLYLKTHSYGEYVFDWSWAEAYAQHGLSYSPKPYRPYPLRRQPARVS